MVNLSKRGTSKRKLKPTWKLNEYLGIGDESHIGHQNKKYGHTVENVEKCSDVDVRDLEMDVTNPLKTIDEVSSGAWRFEFDNQIQNPVDEVERLSIIDSKSTEPDIDKPIKQEEFIDFGYLNKNYSLGNENIHSENIPAKGVYSPLVIIKQEDGQNVDDQQTLINNADLSIEEKSTATCETLTGERFDEFDDQVQTVIDGHMSTINESSTEIGIGIQVKLDELVEFGYLDSNTKFENENTCIDIENKNAKTLSSQLAIIQQEESQMVEHQQASLIDAGSSIEQTSTYTSETRKGGHYSATDISLQNISNETITTKSMLTSPILLDHSYCIPPIREDTSIFGYQANFAYADASNMGVNQTTTSYLNYSDESNIQALINREEVVDIRMSDLKPSKGFSKTDRDIKKMEKCETMEAKAHLRRSDKGTRQFKSNLDIRNANNKVKHPQKSIGSNQSKVINAQDNISGLLNVEMIQMNLSNPVNSAEINSSKVKKSEAVKILTNLRNRDKGKRKFKPTWKLNDCLGIDVADKKEKQHRNTTEGKDREVVIETRGIIKDVINKDVDPVNHAKQVNATGKNASNVTKSEIEGELAYLRSRGTGKRRVKPTWKLSDCLGDEDNNKKAKQPKTSTDGNNAKEINSIDDLAGVINEHKDIIGKTLFQSKQTDSEVHKEVQKTPLLIDKERKDKLET